MPSSWLPHCALACQPALTVDLLPAAASSATTGQSALHASPTSAALLSFITDLPRYPRHLYKRENSSTTAGNNSILPASTARPAHNTATLALCTTTRLHSSPTSDEQQQHRQRAQHGATHSALSTSSPRSASVTRGQVDGGSAVLSHRALLGRVEHFELRQGRHERRTQSRELSSSLTPLDFLVTQQRQRREAAALRREQMQWREHMARLDIGVAAESKCSETAPHDSKARQASGVLSRAITAQSRSSERLERRKSRQRKDREAARQAAGRRQERKQAETDAARQWEQQDEQRDQETVVEFGEAEAASSELAHTEETEHSEQAERNRNTTAAGGNEQKEEADAVTATVQAERQGGHRLQEQQQHPPTAVLPAAPPPRPHPPFLSLAFLLSCLPPSCAAMEWSALCLSHLPLRDEPLGKMADFLSAAHSLIHITQRASSTTASEHALTSRDTRSQQASGLQVEPEPLSLAWLGALLELPPCLFQPVQHSLLAPSQRPHLPCLPVSVAADGADSSETGGDWSVFPVHCVLLRHWARLCEWRWSRFTGPSVDQLLHLLHIAAHKVEVDAQSQRVTVDGGMNVPPAGSIGGLGWPARRFMELLHSSLSESRVALTGALSPSHSHSSHSRVAVSFGSFAVIFTCLFALSSFPNYRASAAVCASIDRVFTAILPVTADETDKEQRTQQLRAARAVETERRAALAKERKVQAQQAEQCALQRLEDRRQREAAILALHPRAGEWSAAAVSGIFIRALPPHPLPPLPLS